MDTSTSKKVFSYCVFGNQKKYCLGMIRNLKQIQELFPEFSVYIYVGTDVPREYIDQYKSFQNVTLIQRNYTGLLLTIERFLCVDDNFDVVFVRDADSRFGHRDMWCIHNFLDSKFNICTIRDHKWHGRELLAGHTGIKRMPHISIQKDLTEFTSKSRNINYYQNDQDFIIKYLFHKHKQDVIAYSEYHNFGEGLNMKIPLPRKSNEDFCGNVYLFDKNDNEYTEFTIHGRK